MELTPDEQVISMGDGTRIISSQIAHRGGYAWIVLSEDKEGVANLLGAGWEDTAEDAENQSVGVAYGFEAVFMYTSTLKG